MMGSTVKCDQLSSQGVEVVAVVAAVMMEASVVDAVGGLSGLSQECAEGDEEVHACVLAEDTAVPWQRWRWRAPALPLPVLARTGVLKRCWRSGASATPARGRSAAAPAAPAEEEVEEQEEEEEEEEEQEEEFFLRGPYYSSSLLLLVLNYI